MANPRPFRSQASFPFGTPPSGWQLQPIRDKRAFRQILQSMNVALRDSNGGGILERFDVISKVLFIKVFDEREIEEGTKAVPDLRIASEDTVETVSRRLDSLWHRTCRRFSCLYPNGTPDLTKDSVALYRIVQLLERVSIVHTPGDIKGLAYEELLRNTFDKNENQQYFTPHEIVEFMVEIARSIRPTPDPAICDPACGTAGFLVEAFRHVKSDAVLVGAEVDERLSRVAQMNLIMHGAERSVVHRLPGAGSLAPIQSIQAALPPSSFDLILTNPPFGSDLLDRTALEEFETGRGRPSRRRSILFMERCLELLRPGGRVAIVLDDSVLNLPSNADIRAHVRSQAIIEAVVSVPDVAFMPYSTAKSSIVVLRKRARHERQGPIFMAEATEVGRRPNGDPLYSDERNSDGSRTLLSDLPGIIEAYRRFGKTNPTPHPKCFVASLPQGSDRLDIFFYHPKRFAAERLLAGCPWPTPPLRDLVLVQRDRINPSQDLGDSPVKWLGLADIEEATGEWEMKTLPADRIKSQAHVFKGGDILFSRLRPNLRKVAFMPDDSEGGICSGEILVLRALDRVSETQLPLRHDRTSVVDSEYLAFMLRSDLIYGQLLYQVTGVGRPRVSQETILALRIPLPSLQEQKRIVSILKKGRDRALKAREQASHWMKRSMMIMDSAYGRLLAELTTSSPVRTNPH